jgi:hypothetical protein
VVVDDARLRWAILASILLHALVLMSMSALRNLRLPLPVSPPTIDVDLASLPPPPPRVAPRAQPKAEPQPQAPPPVLMPKQQIVTPPDAGVEKPPPDTAFLSDRDNTVEQQSVRRGEGAPKEPEAAKAEEEAIPDEPVKPPPAEAKPAKPAPPAPRPVQRAQPRERTEVASLPKLDKLFPLPGEFAAKRPTEGVEPESDRSVTHRNLLPGRRQAFAVSPGVSDFLPTIREGDITLLNTKAERFAPFVRRVAARVFQHLEIQLEHAARSAGNGSAGREYAVVEAVMNKRGELINARLVERETNTQMTVYKQLLTAARPEVFFDANPPPGAEAADGNIHFILLVDLMVQVGADPRTGRASTGYYGMAGVGLDTMPKG